MRGAEGNSVTLRTYQGELLKLFRRLNSSSANRPRLLREIENRIVEFAGFLSDTMLNLSGNELELAEGLFSEILKTRQMVGTLIAASEGRSNRLAEGRTASAITDTTDEDHYLGRYVETLKQLQRTAMRTKDFADSLDGPRRAQPLQDARFQVTLSIAEKASDANTPRGRSA